MTVERIRARRKAAYDRWMRTRIFYMPVAEPTGRSPLRRAGILKAWFWMIAWDIAYHRAINQGATR